MIRSFKNLPIKFKLFGTYAVISLVIFTLSFSVLYFQVQQDLEQQIRGELNQSNQTITDMVETTATVSIKTHLRAIAEKNLEITTHFYRKFLNGDMAESEARDKVVQILLSQTVGDTGYLYCINSKGVAVVHPREGVLGKDFSYRRFIQEQIREKEGYLEYDWQNPGESTARPKALYMIYFEPWDWIISVSSYKSEFIGLIGIDDFKDRILELTFGDTGYSFIIDMAGNSVVHPELSGNLLKMLDANGMPIVKEMIRLKKGFLTYRWKNPSDHQPREKIVAFDHIEGFDWIIASSSYTREVFAPLIELKRSFLLILILVVLVTGGITLVVSSTITRPLRVFIRQFERGARGDWASRLDHDGDDEIGKLSRSFNRFMDRLDAYRRKLVLEINDRKKAQQELNSLRNYLANIIDSMPSILIGVDQDGRVTQWNRKAEQATGVAMAAATGKFLLEVFPRLGPHMHNIRASLGEKQVRQILKTPHSRKGNRSEFEDITIYPLTADGISGAVIRIDDVSGKVRMEEMLVQNEKMLSVGGLAAGMAHEINNPLAGVVQNANVMSNRLMDKTLPANLKAAEKTGVSMEAIQAFMQERDIPRMLSAINNSGLRMASIVSNMLSFARKSDASFSSCEPAELLDKSLELASTDYDLKKQYDFKSIHVVKEYEHGLPLIFCESSKIQQVFLNILTNGAHAMFETKSTPGYRPEFILRIHRDTDPAMVCIEIEDNGPGMDAATRKRVFEPFFTTKPVGVGTGLGLSVSYFIVTENHGGEMDVRSEPDKGTTFIIRLPIKRHQPEE